KIERSPSVGAKVRSRSLEGNRSRRSPLTSRSKSAEDCSFEAANDSGPWRAIEIIWLSEGTRGPPFDGSRAVEAARSYSQMVRGICEICRHGMWRPALEP